MDTIRVAICQIKSHSAIYASHINYLEEPFIPTGNVTLTQLGTKGIPVSESLSLCEREYLLWSEKRTKAVVENLESIDPKPDLILFPEGSITINELEFLGSWSTKNNIVILAGTHTPRNDIDSLKVYESIGISKGHIRRITEKGSRNVLPILCDGRCKLITKKHSSPFERSVLSKKNKNRIDVRPYQIMIGEEEINLLPLICSEALIDVHATSDYQLVSIISLNEKVDKFKPYIDFCVTNKKIVMLCNDGAYGGSNIITIEDDRRKNWFRDAFINGLPQGESILIADIDLSVNTVQVGTSDPNDAFRLISLREIVYENDSSSYKVSEEIKSIKNIGSVEGRVQELKNVLRNENISESTNARVKYLLNVESKGLPSKDIWDTLGEDCVIENMQSLYQLEQILAKSVVNKLHEVAFTSTPKDEQTSHNIISYIAECNNVGGIASPKPNSVNMKYRDESVVLDRENEIDKILLFLNNPQQKVYEISGLPQIGKTSLIKKALNLSGFQKISIIELSEDASIDFIIYSIIKITSEEPEPPYTDFDKVINSSELKQSLSSIDVLCITNSRNLLDYGMWKDIDSHRVLLMLIDLADDLDTKIIFESQRNLPIEYENPIIRGRLRLLGLKNKDGKKLFDSQLRTISAPIDIVTDEGKNKIVETTGGHPVAISLVADAIFISGIDTVTKILKQKSGFYFYFLKRIVKTLQLVDEEVELLKIYALTRTGIPRELAMQSVNFSANKFLNNLIQMNAIESAKYGFNKISPIISEYFKPEDLPSEQIQSFHEAAAKLFVKYSNDNNRDISLAIEAEYHASLAGINIPIKTNLFDGVLSTAKKLYSNQQYEKADRLLSSLIGNNPKQEILRLSSLVKARLNDFDTAIKYAKSVFSKDRKDTYLLSELIKIALTQSRDDVADELIDVARKAQVEDVSILLSEGRILLRRNEAIEAEEVFERAVQLTTRNPWPYFYLGRAYLKKGRIDDAIDVLYEGENFIFENHINSKNALSAIQTQLGLTYLFNGNLDLAEQRIESLFAENPDNPEVIRAYAALTIKREGITEAHKALKALSKASIKNRYDRCQFHLLYGLFYLGIDDKESARKEFEKAHAQDRTNVFVMINWAEAVYDIAERMWLDGNDKDEYAEFVDNCRYLVKQILSYDIDNERGVALMHKLHRNFKVEL